MIVSRAAQPAVALACGRLSEIRVPGFESPDHRGAGDSMTGGLVAGLIRRTGILIRRTGILIRRTGILIRRTGMEQALKPGAAAVALNATRNGLGTGHRDLIEQLARRVGIPPVEL